MLWVGSVPVLWKKNDEEAEMIRYYELVLYQSRESRTKKKQFTEDSLSPGVYILAISWLSTSLHYFVHFLIKRKEMKQIIFLYKGIAVCFGVQHMQINNVG